MNCLRCDRENRADARFCLGCGAPFARVCACGRELPGDAAFCDACGTPVAARSAPGAPSERSAEAALEVSARALADYRTRGDARAALAAVRDAVTRADGSGDLGARLATRHAAIAIAQAADLELALRYADEALEMLDADDSSDVGIELLDLPALLIFVWQRACVAAQCGRLEDAVEGATRLREIATDHPDWTWFADNADSRCQLLAGDFAQALLSAREQAQHDAAKWSTGWQIAAQQLLGEALVGNADFKRAVQCLEEATRELERSGAVAFMQPELSSLLARAKAELGETGRAVELAREALSLSIDRGMRAIEASLRITLGFTLLADLAAASRADVEAELARLAELEDEGCLTGVDACRAIELRAALAEALGEAAAAGVLRRTLRARYQSMGATGRVAQLTERLAASS